jgi:very-short-patch-repair endonuclease
MREIPKQPLQNLPGQPEKPIQPLQKLPGQPKKPKQPLQKWLAESERSGIAHAHEALRAGYTRYELRAALRLGRVTRIRRDWLALPSAPADLRTAAQASGRIACLSLAKRLKLWTMDDDLEHLSVSPHSTYKASEGQRLHWSRNIVPVGRYALVEPIENALVQIADCQPFENALVVWDSALNSRRVSEEQLARLPLRSEAARKVRATSTCFSDSGIETIPVSRLALVGITVRQQVVLCGHAVDGLIGDRLVLQIDGYAHHSSAAQRRSDIAHDRVLVFRGYTVLRYDYKEILFEWPRVEQEILQAIAQRLHRA